MKKRSLFSAVAMLIVSAIVLTSATYAWFASNQNADVDPISASITKASDGSLLLKGNAENSNWKTHLAHTTVEGEVSDFDSSTIATTYGPVSVAYDGTNFSAFGGSLNGTEFKASSTTAGDNSYSKYNFKLKTSVDSEVIVKPSFTRGFTYGYCLVVVSGVKAETANAVGGKLWFLYGAAGDSYIPVTSAATTAIDTSGDAIISADELTAGTLGNAMTASACENYNILTAAETEVTFDVYLWAEGQDAECTGTTGGVSYIEFDFEKVTTESAE